MVGAVVQPTIKRTWIQQYLIPLTVREKYSLKYDMNNLELPRLLGIIISYPRTCKEGSVTSVLLGKTSELTERPAHPITHALVETHITTYLHKSHVLHSGSTLHSFWLPHRNLKVMNVCKWQHCPHLTPINSTWIPAVNRVDTSVTITSHGIGHLWKAYDQYCRREPE